MCIEFIIHVRAALNSWLHNFLFSWIASIPISKIYQRALVVAIRKTKKAQKVIENLLTLHPLGKIWDAYEPIYGFDGKSQPWIKLVF